MAVKGLSTMFTYLLTYFGAWGLGVGCGRVGWRGEKVVDWRRVP